MHDQFKDKLTILLPAPCQIKLPVLAALLLLCAACAGPHQGGNGPEPSPAAVQAAAEDDESAALYHITTAEKLIGVGEYEQGLAEYLSAARVSDDPEVARQVARLASRLGDWPAVIEAAERWRTLRPGAAGARHLIALARVNNGEIGAAVDELERTVTETPDGDGWRRAAMLLGAANDPDLAQAAFDRLVERSGEAAGPGRIAHAESILLWQHGDDDQALERALEAAGQLPERDTLVWAAQLAMNNESPEQALALYRQAREQAPDDAPLALAEAEVLRQLDRDEAALEVLRGLPPGSESLYTLGIYLVQQERLEEAETAWEQLAGLQPEQRGEHHAYLVARLADLLERDADALEWYERVDGGPNREQAMLRRAVLQGYGGELAAARELLATLRRDADDAMRREAWLVEAELLREGGQPEMAIEILAQPLRESPTSVDLLYARALSAAVAGDIDLAEQDLRRIIQMDATNAMALNALGYTLTDQTDRHQEAYRLIERALELDPEDPATLDSMGWVLYRMGRAEEALPYLEEALAADGNPEIAAHLIEVLWQLDRQEEARELADETRREHPDHSYLNATLERLGLSG